MKNVLKTFGIAAAITISIGACSGNGQAGKADSSKVDSSTSVSTSTDTLVKTDVNNRDTTGMLTDTAKNKVDTMSKTITTKKVIKKTIVTKP